MQNGAKENLRLPAEVDLAAANVLLDELKQRVAIGAPLRVDASAVQAMTLPGVQVIQAAARDYGRVIACNPSADFLNAFDEFGIDRTGILDCVEEIAPVENKNISEIPAPAVGAAGDCDISGEDINPPISEGAMSKRIMTIDDSKTMRDMLMLTLVEAGFDVLQAVDGQDGIEKLKGEYVDAVITDINMPKMDGYEVVRQLRADPKFSRTPILVLTTEAETEKRDLARKAGATGWMVKPFDPDRLVETVRKVIAA
jgi:Response regulators consisting of a CheY-like receiver domain and a winged-helix DNA-binding domain